MLTSHLSAHHLLQIGILVLGLLGLWFGHFQSRIPRWRYYHNHMVIALGIMVGSEYLLRYVNLYLGILMLFLLSEFLVNREKKFPWTWFDAVLISTYLFLVHDINPSTPLTQAFWMAQIFYLAREAKEAQHIHVDYQGWLPPMLILVGYLEVARRL